MPERRKARLAGHPMPRGQHRPLTAVSQREELLCASQPPPGGDVISEPGLAEAIRIRGTSGGVLRDGGNGIRASQGMTRLFGQAAILYPS
jgi:hypothetical protein